MNNLSLNQSEQLQISLKRRRFILNTISHYVQLTLTSTSSILLSMKRSSFALQLHQFLSLTLWHKKSLEACIYINPQLFLLLLNFNISNSRLPLLSVITPPFKHRLAGQTHISHQLIPRVLIDEAAVHRCNMPPLHTAAPRTQRFHGHYCCIPWHSFPVKLMIEGASEPLIVRHTVLVKWCVTSYESALTMQLLQNEASSTDRTSFRQQPEGGEAGEGGAARCSLGPVPFPTEQLHRSSWGLIALLKGTCF